MTKFDWVKCPRCGHKLFKAFDGYAIEKLEIKCSSCKKIILVCSAGVEAKEGLTSASGNDTFVTGGRND